MSRTVSRASLSTMAGVRSALVVISPATTTRSVVTSVSHATRLVGSTARQWSRTASLIWSATLSGWPMLTDSLVNRYRSEFTEVPRAGTRKGRRCRKRTEGCDYKEKLGQCATGLRLLPALLDLFQGFRRLAAYPAIGVARGFGQGRHHGGI